MTAHIDMLSGPMLGKIFTFSLPLIASGVLQQSFNAVDVAIVGHFSTSEAMAGVGSNGPVISILVALFLGIAVGANVVIAYHIGKGDKESIRRSISTVGVIAIVSGVLLACIGVPLAKPILQLMNAPDEVLDMAVTYLSIYFAGMPFIMIYNFGSAILRSMGDTKLPFYSLLIATVTNFILDIVFVGPLNTNVAGAAGTTVFSNALNAGIVVWFLYKEPDPYTLRLKHLRISKPDLKKMLRIGIPAGLQGMVFSISNIFIQSTINGFGAAAIAGSAAALTYEAYCYYIVAAFSQAAIAFTGQNYGARKPDRCRRVFGICMMYSTVLCALCNILIVVNGPSCLSLFTADPQVLHYALIRFNTVLLFQSIASTYEISSGYMRGLGYSMLPMILTIFGTCVLRLGWIYFVPETHTDFHVLLDIYPITWTLTGVLVLTAAFIVQHRVFRRLSLSGN